MYVPDCIERCLNLRSKADKLAQENLKPVPLFRPAQRPSQKGLRLVQPAGAVRLEQNADVMAIMPSSRRSRIAT